MFWSLIRPDIRSFMNAGEYDRLYKIFRKIFLCLKRLHITAYVVLDGGSNSPQKDKTTCSRIKQGINQVNRMCTDPQFKRSSGLPRPLLADKLFIQVMREMGIPFVVAKG